MVAGIGKANFVQGDWIARRDQTSASIAMPTAPLGDVDLCSKERVVVTPVPGGVGLTIATLLANTSRGGAAGSCEDIGALRARNRPRAHADLRCHAFGRVNVWIP